jgi:hypothetical protein
MPDSRTHQIVGSLVGGGNALISAWDSDPAGTLIELVGGMYGGSVGGLLPDWIEPALSPKHRRLAHSWGALLASIATNLQAAQDECRRQAAVCLARSQDPTLTAINRFLLQVGWFFWRFAAGFLSGFAPGYASHLALDGCTPMGLPLIGLL